MSEPEPLLTEQQVSAWLGLHPVTLKKLRLKGGIPARKVGRTVRYDRDEVRAWLEQPTSALPVTEPEPRRKGAGGARVGGTRARLRELHEEALKRASMP